MGRKQTEVFAEFRELERRGKLLAVVERTLDRESVGAKEPSQKSFEKELAQFRKDADALLGALERVPKDKCGFEADTPLGVISRLRGLLALHQLATDPRHPPADAPWED